MSSNQSQGREYIVNLNQKFDSQFSNINGLLDKVIDKNNHPVPQTTQNVHQYSANTGLGDYSYQTQPNNRVKEGVWQPYTTFASPSRDNNYSTSLHPPVQIDNVLRTPVKIKTSPYSHEHKLSDEKLQKDDSYDYNSGHQSHSRSDSAKHSKPELYKNNKNLRGVDSTQDIIFEEHSTFHISKDNIDSPRNRKFSQAQEYLSSKSAQNTDRARDQDHDVSANFDYSQNTDIFGEKSPLKCKLPRQKRTNSPPKNLVKENLERYEKDLVYSNKYAPQDVLKSIEPSEDGKFYLVNAVKKEQPAPKSEDPIDQIVVLTCPAQEVKPADKLVGIYQQVSESYLDGTSYIGEKFLGLRQGKGTYYYHEGYRFEGTWDEDKMSGFGILWVNDDVKWYEGEWEDNTFHGRGIIYNVTPEDLEPGKEYSKDMTQIGNGWIKYEGRFENGAKHGFGTLFLSNGDSFTGNFALDNVEGRGSYSQADSKNIIAGTWRDNLLKSSY